MLSDAFYVDADMIRDATSESTMMWR
jgi:hypothetical protein